MIVPTLVGLGALLIGARAGGAVAGAVEDLPDRFPGPDSGSFLPEIPDPNPGLTAVGIGLAVVGVAVLIRR